MSIEIRELSKHFMSSAGMRPVLDRASLSVQPGETVCLMGPNGAGKTTLLKLLSGLVLPDSGSLSVCGHDVVLSPIQARSCVGLVTDSDRGFYQVLSIADNLRFYGRLFNMKGRAVEERIKAFSSLLGLGPWIDEPVAHCSAGIRQRAAFARALLPGPSVLLLDEAGKSLDAASMDVITGQIRSLVLGGAACIAVTHDRSWAEKHADRVCELSGGIIRERGAA